MRLKMLHLLCLGLAAIALSGCSDDDGDGSSSSSSEAVIEAVNSVNTKVTEAAAVIDSGSGLISWQPNTYRPFSAGIDTVWTTDPGVKSLYDGSNYSLKEWFADQFDPEFFNSNNAQTNFVGRIASTLRIFCYLGAMGLTTDSKNLPTVGTHDASLTASQAETCGEEELESSMDLTVTVTNTSDTTLYDRSLSVDFGNECPFIIKARISSTEINIATSEDQSCDGRDQASSTVVLYDKANDKMRFTYISQAFDDFPSGFEFYRGYYDGGADLAYMLGQYGSDDGTAGAAGLDSGVAYTVIGKPSAGGTAAVSAKVYGETIGDNVYNGCINTTSLAATSTTDTLTCTETGIDVDDSFTDVIVAARAAHSEIDDIYQITDTTTVGFTDEDDMF